MFIPVIISGGAGTRLWPVSREMHPKPFIKLQDGQSLLQKTLSRIIEHPKVTEVLTVTNKEFYFKTKEEYKFFNSEKMRFILEPFGRNTAPAIALAACYAWEKYGPDCILLILPADHLIKHEENFNQMIETALKLAKENKLITFGIKPTRPESQFGYIKFNAPYYDKEMGEEAYIAEAFIEKPSEAMAEQFIATGRYLWNSGMFCFNAETILTEFKIMQPTLFEELQKCWQASKDKTLYGDAIEIDAQTFKPVENCSLDYAIMEKAEEVVVLPADLCWTDVGSWNAMSELISPDVDGNYIQGEAIVMNSNNSFIQSSDRLVAVIGANNLMIVDTPDALLVATREDAQNVKKIVDELRKKNHNTYRNHMTIYRPWGTYTTLEESHHFKIKRIVVKPQAALSLQMHYHRSEHWIVVSGTAKVTNGVKTSILNTNESIFIPMGDQHRLENPGLVDLVIIEVQTGEYLGEDDIVRFDDKYGRINIKDDIAKLDEKYGRSDISGIANIEEILC